MPNTNINNYELLTADEASTISKTAEANLEEQTISLLIKYAAKAGLNYLLYQNRISIELKEKLQSKKYTVKDIEHCAIPGRLVLISWE